MREIGERTQLLTLVAGLYYEQNLTQQEIAEQLALTRSNVSRLLTEARERGIVEIRVQHFLPTAPLLEAELRKRFHLRDACVLKADTREPNLVLRDIGALAADQLRRLVHQNITLALGWGRALYETVHAFRPISVPNVRVVQMMGGIGALNPQFDGTEMARRLAKAVGGQFYYPRAPMVVESAAVRDALLQERDVRTVIEMGRRADVAITGIGSVRPELSGLVRAGYLTEEDMNTAVRAGAVCDIYGQYVTITGQLCQLELHQRLIGCDLPSLRKINCVLAVAASAEKATAILGAVRGGFVHILVTDDAAAQEVLRLADIM